MGTTSLFGNVGVKKKIEATSFFGIARFCFDLIATAIDLKLVLFLSCLFIALVVWKRRLEGMEEMEKK